MPICQGHTLCHGSIVVPVLESSFGQDKRRLYTQREFLNLIKVNFLQDVPALSIDSNRGVLRGETESVSYANVRSIGISRDAHPFP